MPSRVSTRWANHPYEKELKVVGRRAEIKGVEEKKVLNKKEKRRRREEQNTKNNLQKERMALQTSSWDLKMQKVKQSKSSSHIYIYIWEGKASGRIPAQVPIKSSTVGSPLYHRT